jgi:arylsulfatase A-like enzyme
MAQNVKTLSFVVNVFTRAEVTAGSDGASEVVQQFRRNYYPGRSPDLFVQYKKYYLIGAGKTGTDHGSVYEYDTRVPMLFMGKGVRAGHFDAPCATVDFAPTLAKMMRLNPPAEVDGKALDVESLHATE